MVTPQTNATLDDIASALLQRESVVLCGHVGPDGDCLGSQLALYHALRALGKRVVCVLAKSDPVDPNLSFMPGLCDMVPAAECAESFDVFLGVDVPSRERMGDDAWELRGRCGFTITLDHHAMPESISNMNYVDPDAAATALLAWRLVEMLGVARTAKIATCAYTGLMTDTGRFQFQNANAEAFAAAAEMVAAGARADEIAKEVFQNRSLAAVKLESVVLQRMRFTCDGAVALSWVTLDDFAACHAVKSDAESLVNTLRSIRGVRVSCMLREQEDGIRGSLRAKDDTDVSAIARLFGGGGHKAAAGFTLHEDMDTAIERMTELLTAVLDGASNPASEISASEKELSW